MTARTTKADRSNIRSLRTVSLSFGGYETRAIQRAGRGPVLLCLHGFADSADGFRTLFAALRDTQYRLIALDLPGFGKGPPLAPRPASVLPQLVDFALAAVEHFSNGRPLLLLGHSLGGRTALAAAAQTRLPIAGVIALAPAPLRLNPLLRLIAAEQRLLPAAAKLLGHLPDGFMRRRYLQGYRRTFFEPDAASPELISRRMAGRDARRVADEAESMLRIGSEIDHRLDLSPVTAPVDLVWGRDDRLIPTSAARIYRKHIEHARYHELPRCGHEIAQERAVEVAALIRRRLEQDAPGRT